MTNHLRTGYTTGACAAGAAKAAWYAYLGQQQTEITIKNLQGQEIHIPVKESKWCSVSGLATGVVIKDGGDDPDATHGMEIVVRLAVNHSGETIVQGGPGVGKVTKPGLQISVGDWAINPVPRAMIEQTLREIMPDKTGVVVTIEVPGGEEVALKTLNPKLGIIGGISILGTTGIVRPMSQEAFQDSLTPQLGLALAHGYTTIVLTPGHMGERFAIDGFGFPEECVIQMSNFVGHMLEASVAAGIKKVLLWGHHGKLVKVAGGSFNTHSKVADGRRETIAAYASLCGASPELVSDVLSSNTAEEAAQLLEQAGLLQKTFAQLAMQASSKATAFVNNCLQVGTALLSLKGDILAIDENGWQIGSELGWKLSKS